jgi:hypothetical protein
MGRISVSLCDVIYNSLADLEKEEYPGVLASRK